MVNPENLLITKEYVREALDEMIQTTASKTVSPLEFLQLIDLHMLSADYTFFQNPRRFALNDLLITIIQTHYVRQRSLHGFPPVNLDQTMMDATQIIVDDSTTGNADLIGWSWLYFHYVEVSLHVTQQQFCSLVNLDDRTIRRYHNSTIDTLVNHLIRTEQSARESRRKLNFYNQLPHKGTIRHLLERENEIRLVKKSRRKHFYVIGSAGIGKTTFVEYLLKLQIDSDELDRLVWINAPNSIGSVQSYLREYLLPKESKITLLEFVSLKRTVIVLDNIEELQENIVHLQTFLGEFSQVTIFLLSRVFSPIRECVPIHLGELSTIGSEMLLREQFGDDVGAESSFNKVTQVLKRSIGGNPLALELIAQNINVFEPQSAVEHTIDELYAHLYALLTESQRLAWLVCALLNGQSYEIVNTVEASFFSLVSVDDFTALQNLLIVTTVQSDTATMTMPISASHFIRLRYKKSLELQKLFNDVVDNLHATPTRNMRLNLAFTESVLLADWVILSPINFKTLSEQFWREGMNKGHYAQWYTILSKVISEVTSENLDLVVAYGVTQRVLGQWEQANTIFGMVIEYAGIRGLFSKQFEALLERAILYHYQGEYSRALADLNYLERPSDTTDINPSSLRNRILVERIEIALESHNIEDAKALFMRLPEDYDNRLIFQLEIYAYEADSERDLPFLASINEKLLTKFNDSKSLQARIHVLIGRIYQKIKREELAVRHFSIAHSILTEIDNDPFGLARTQTNLAALFINSNQYIEAQELLRLSEHIQRIIGDRTGLATTLHNVRVLNRKIVD